MKLSLNFPDDYQQQNQNQILKAKVPITIIHHPFTATATTAAAAVSGLSFSLATNFASGPSFKLSYTPATTTNSPFSLSFKSGLGLFGSPQSSPLVFSAQFFLSPTNPPNPTFFLHFKPQLGHFSLHKSTSSNPNPNPNPIPKPDSILGSHSISGSHFGSGSITDSDSANGFVPEGPLAWQDLKLEPCGSKEGFTNPDSNENCGIGLVSGRQLGWKNGKKGGFLNGVAVTARTVLPVTRRVVVNLRWGVNLGADFGSKLPYLTVNKIGIERIQEVEEKRNESNVGDKELLKGMCLWMRRDLELLENENREMKQCLREIREWVSARKFHGESDSVRNKVAQPLSETSSGFERWSSKKNGDENGTKELKKHVNLVSDVESELQRAIKAASTQ